MSVFRFIRAWTWQAIAIYLLAEFAIFTICSRLLHAYTHRTPDPPWGSEVAFYFLPLTLSAWWVLGVLFRPRDTEPKPKAKP